MRIFRAIIGRESVETDEGRLTRVFPAGCFEWDDGPKPATLMHDDMALKGTVLGRIDRIERLGDLILGYGVLDDEGEGEAADLRRDVIRQIDEQMINAISVEPAGLDMEEECTATDEDGFCEAMRVTFTRYRIGAMSLVTIPAIEGTLIELDPVVAEQPASEPVAAVAASASSDDLVIPAAWIVEPDDLPDLDAPGSRVPVVTAEGRTYGWLCAWDDCFAGETEYLTEHGVRTLKETVGTVQRVLSSPSRPESDSRKQRNRKQREHGGQWVDAEIRSFGVRPLVKVTLRRYGQTKEVYATARHRWLVTPLGKEGFRYTPQTIVRTTDLVAGSRLSPLFPKIRATRGKGIRPSQFGVAHGFTFGDGTRHRDGCRAELYGDKDAALLPYFSMSKSHSTVRSNGMSQTRVSNLPAFFKDLPPLSESLSYLYGWLAGYFAADGCVTEKGTPIIYSATKAHLEFYRDTCARLGIGTSEIKTSMRQGYGNAPSPLHRMTLIAHTLSAEFFLLDEHRRRFEARPTSEDGGHTGWRVVSVEETDRVEEVFCAVVPDHENFTLMDNINVMNCHTSFANYCQTPWRSPSGYAYAMHSGPFRTDEGDTVTLAPLSASGGHASTTGSAARDWRAARSHYDNPDNCAAYVAFGENDRGVWFSGIVRPDAPDRLVNLLRRHQLSGDWRRPFGEFELMGACSVNQPGFVRRAAFVASAEGNLELVAAVVAAGGSVSTVGCDCGGTCETCAPAEDTQRITIGGGGGGGHQSDLTGLRSSVQALTEALGHLQPVTAVLDTTESLDVGAEARLAAIEAQLRILVEFLEPSLRESLRYRLAG